MNLVIKILIAFILDLIFGDPKNILHPVQIIGKLIIFLENKFYKLGKNNRARAMLFGAILSIIVVISTFFAMFIISLLSKNYKTIFTIIEIYLMYTVFSVKSLGNCGKKIYKILKLGNLEKAKKELSNFVSRDTQNMDKITVIRSTMETISENMTDGIIAPMFFMFLGGLPLAMSYKAVNTLDSMIGYKNKKYEYFGKFAAILDDFANFIPARISGVCITIASFFLRYNYRRAWNTFKRDRKKHASPNSAHSESAVAGALGVQFGGAASYFGKVVQKPTIGKKLKEFRAEDIKRNIRLMYATSFVTLIIFSFIYLTIKGIFNGLFAKIGYLILKSFVEMFI